MTLLCLFSMVACLPGQDTVAPQIPKELSSLVGTFTGSWTMFGINDKGDVVPKMKWTDVITITKPTVEKGRVLVETVDEMTFIEPKYLVRKSLGKEGYYINKDGTLGEYFIEMNGAVTRMMKVEEDVWAYSTKAAPQELTMLGFPKGSTGKHVLVKIVTREDGKESHRISRITSIQWTDKKGETQWKQYISLQGVHQK